MHGLWKGNVFIKKILISYVYKFYVTSHTEVKFYNDKIFA